MPTTRIIKNPTEMKEVASLVLEHIDVSQKASVLALHGELGAGKTTFVQTLAQIIGVESNVTSPTFVVMKQYPLETNKNGIEQLIHIDAYRIEEENEMKPLYFEEMKNTPGLLICVEWAEKIKNLLPSNLINIHINIINEIGEREVVIHGI